LAKKQSKLSQKKRVSHSKKGKGNGGGSMNNIYKRTRGNNKDKKDEKMTIYQNKEKTLVKGYVTERGCSGEKEDMDHRILSKGYVTNPDEGFENIYEKQNIKGKIWITSVSCKKIDFF
jgi:hypothetical protein